MEIFAAIELVFLLESQSGFSDKVTQIKKRLIG